jgi:hypothetical protein
MAYGGRAEEGEWTKGGITGGGLLPGKVEDFDEVSRRRRRAPSSLVLVPLPTLPPPSSFAVAGRARHDAANADQRPARRLGTPAPCARGGRRPVGQRRAGVGQGEDRGACVRESGRKVGVEARHADQGRGRKNKKEMYGGTHV